jgi:hypothetical protein
MFPNIDPAAATGMATQAATIRRPETDRVTELYRAPGPRTAVAADGTDALETGSSARAAERPGTRVARVRSDTGAVRKPSQRGDQAEINFQMSREEREVFLSAMSGREEVSEMSEAEQEMMERATERLDKLIEAASARDTASRERVDKAVKEWYLRLSNGKQPPADLLTLIRQSAAGKLK